MGKFWRHGERVVFFCALTVVVALAAEARADEARLLSQAFGAALNATLPPLSEAELGPFARDPYAFVLYGRGLGVYLGLAGFAHGKERGIEILKRSLVIDPKTPEVRRYLGFCYLEGGQP